ncbi:unnamed protein product [Didymodactylos carnosus]|uniref:carbonic anhydrase n=1 Tax=Didymodactylos carnosus TaxID=1234261 RepID=A0A815WD20_9BILA|nr:unnamed protein product [Didymodactylos carnosus]CAF1543272.1 unnamed protein product [Didymodactylos carnosus]CAF3792573.1 unnamed protein product [Didymodactylos carnosus]CAF4403720.1 unnamed protein product [Didymodactylos carnosus]
MITFSTSILLIFAFSHQSIGWEVVLDEPSQNRFHWSYAKPNDWSNGFPQCSGTQQSPIDLNVVYNNCLTTYKTHDDPIIFSPGYQKWLSFVLTNDGHSVVGTPANASDGPDLYIHGNGLNDVYHFNNFHVHWPAEHFSQENMVEVHFVHQNEKTKKIVVLAYYLKISRNPNPFWALYVVKAVKLKAAGQKITYATVLARMMNGNQTKYFQYPVNARKIERSFLPGWEP